MDIKKAFIYSFVSHCFIVLPMANLWVFSQAPKTNEIKVTYFKAAPAQKIEATGGASQIPANPVLTAKQPKKIARPRHAAGKPKPPQIKPPVTTAKAAAPAAGTASSIIAMPKAEDIFSSSIPGTTLPNTPECMNYYRYIREKILGSLKRNYVEDCEEGEVHVNFELRQTGELINLAVIEEKSSKDPLLLKITYESIEGAAPFKPFPKGLAQKEISFHIPIAFKHR
jgi:outer membrane biosynthesis protein TonB